MRHRFALGALLFLLVPGIVGLMPSAAPPRADAAVSARPVDGGGRGPDPYWPFDGNGGTDARHYAVTVAYDFARKVLRGRTTITMTATRDLRTFNLDLLLPVTGVRVEGRRAAFSKPSSHEVRIRPARTIKAGKRFSVTVAYRGRPAPLAYAGERNWLADAHEVVAMNQPHMAPWWFASNDHPSDKATFDIRVIVPRGREVISNGTRVGRRVIGDRAITRWRMDQPMTTYLAYFAAGDFTIETGRSKAGIRYVNAVSQRLGRAERSDALRELRATAGVTDWLATRFGRYPFSSTGGLVTSLDVGFALENQTRPTYGAWINRDVVVHELAHQWFGDSLAVRRWRDIWVNEGFATFAEHLYAASHGGDSVATWLRGAYRDRCSQPSSTFWTLDIDNPGAANIFDTAVYDRGAMVLGALSNKVGVATLTGVLRAWADTHRGGNVTSQQFEDFAERRTGQDLTPFFDAWLRGGRPPAATADNGLAGVGPC